MSKIIATKAIRGAHKLVARAETTLIQALEEKGPKTKVEFPNTGYFLPISYGLLGLKIETLDGLKELLREAKLLLPPIPDENLWRPYLGPALDAGIATLFADEIIEAIKYTENPLPYLTEANPQDGKLWLGAANDVIMRERGIEFVDGTAPGFAAIVGACPTNEIAVKIARELQEKNLYVFLSASTNGKSVAQQLQEEGVQLGWETRLVPFGDDVTATIHGLGFATRAALSFGGAKPGDYEQILHYNKNRIFAFVLAFGPVDDEKHAQAAGAISFGFPAIADTDIGQILPNGICTYEHVVSPVPHDTIVSRDINWVRISKEAQRAGFKFAHFGTIIHAMFHNDYGALVDKVQVTLLTDKTEVAQRIDAARRTYHERDERLAGLTDEAVETFYSCLLCQSFAPNHVCIITPERSGLCGAYNWLDAKAAHQIKPAGPNQPVSKGRVIDALKGQWAGVNECVVRNSHQTLELFNLYSIIECPMTSCGCFECVSCVLPTCNGIMTVYREFPDPTPSGMKFSTLAGTVGGGLQTPGFIGHSKHYIGSKKFILAEGGIRRLVWMHKSLKEEMADIINSRAAEYGLRNFIESVADETLATTEEQVLEYITRLNHPALSLPPLF